VRDDLLQLSGEVHAQFRRFILGVEYDKEKLIHGLMDLLQTMDENHLALRYCEECRARLTNKRYMRYRKD